MVVLTIIAPSSEHTVYFDQPIPKPSYIRLLSASLYYLWYNLKELGQIEVIKSDIEDPYILLFDPGYYSPKNMAISLNKWFTYRHIKIIL